MAVKQKNCDALSMTPADSPNLYRCAIIFHFYSQNNVGTLTANNTQAFFPGTNESFLGALSYKLIMPLFDAHPISCCQLRCRHIVYSNGSPPGLFCSAHRTFFGALLYNPYQRQFHQTRKYPKQPKTSFPSFTFSRFHCLCFSECKF